MAKIDFVRFLPTTESEVAAQKVNYRQEKHLETQLRSLEKAERYSKNILEKTNTILKQNMRNRMQRNALQPCLKYSNSEKDGERYVALNRKTRQNSINLDDSKHMIPRFSICSDTKSLSSVSSSSSLLSTSSKENVGNSHRRLTRSSSDSCATHLPNAVPSRQNTAIRSLSLDAGSVYPPTRPRRSATPTVNTRQGARIAWESDQAKQQNSELSRSDVSLPRLTPTIPSFTGSGSARKLYRDVPLDVMPKQHMQLRRSRSLPNTSLYSTSPSSKGKLSSLIEVSHRAENEETTKCEQDNGNRSRKNSRKESTVFPPDISQLSVSDDKRAQLQHMKVRPAWYESNETKSLISRSNGKMRVPLQISKSLE